MNASMQQQQPAPFNAMNPRMRATSDSSAASGQPFKQNYNQSQPFNHNQYNNNNNRNNNNRFQPKPFPSNNNGSPSAFKAMAGFQPAAASGLTAKSVGQKMGAQGLKHKEIQRPQQNPW